MKKLVNTPIWIFSFFKFLQVFLLLILLCLFLPWQQFSSGGGRVIALNPNERLQEISAPVDGVVKSWSVTEGQKVLTGEVLLEMSDNDPAIIDRLEMELSAAEKVMGAAELALKTGKLNLDRQKLLLDKGLASSRDYERVKIDISKLEMEYSRSQAYVANAKRNLARQQTQVIKAPRDGVVVRVRAGEGGLQVKTGDVLLVFAPKTSSLAVELWLDPNDVPLVKKGSKARIQFAGWPAVQTPGWPGLAIGTFRGQVQLVDTASSYNNLFRVLIVPNETWPTELFLKQGTLAYGFVNFGTVRLGQELWRLFNGVPPKGAPIEDELEKIMFDRNQKKGLSQ